MTILEFAKQNGTRTTARKVIDQVVSKRFGIGIDDLPDGPELCDYIDTVEEIIEDGFKAGAIDNERLRNVVADLSLPDTFEMLIIG